MTEFLEQMYQLDRQKLLVMIHEAVARLEAIEGAAEETGDFQWEKGEGVRNKEKGTRG